MHLSSNNHRCALFTKDFVKKKLSKLNSRYSDDLEEERGALSNDAIANPNEISKQNDNNNELLTDAITGLTLLGYKKAQARKYAIEALKCGKTTIEDIIKFSLQLARNKK